MDMRYISFFTTSLLIEISYIIPPLTSITRVTTCVNCIRNTP
ncbi:hypothetical protein SAMN06264855_1202 [Halorubrum vacuolatum]|uniref:Uncharacterized protein n=1 Tax=Halorubrum vacuolatum TaxID=63740 RepID=A0A238XMR2_HALVU|nr:hypothetical protein SAMN06264855_1202 [Halorubrum vacuolatum]